MEGRREEAGGGVGGGRWKGLQQLKERKAVDGF